MNFILVDSVRHVPAMPEGFSVSGVTRQGPLVTKGHAAGRVVADYTEQQSREFTDLFLLMPHGSDIERTMQAGAAATELVANLLHALLNNNDHEARELIASYVNDAVDTGIVAVGA